MPPRPGTLPPFADQRPSASQTGAHILKALRRPIVWVILVGMVIAWYGVTGVTTALRKMDEVKRESRRHVTIYRPDGETYIPAVRELCGPESQDWENCFPYYAHKKRVKKCKQKIRLLEDCAQAAQDAETACRRSDPTLSEAGIYSCARNLMHPHG